MDPIGKIDLLYKIIIKNIDKIIKFSIFIMIVPFLFILILYLIVIKLKLQFEHIKETILEAENNNTAHDESDNLKNKSPKDVIKLFKEHNSE